MKVTVQPGHRVQYDPKEEPFVEGDTFECTAKEAKPLIEGGVVVAEKPAKADKTPAS